MVQKMSLPEGITFIDEERMNIKQIDLSKTDTLKVGQFLVSLPSVSVAAVSKFRQIFPRLEYIVLKRKMNTL